jgi:peptidoglycan hydrolase-like protein with peptidoglycan-binding domain
MFAADQTACKTFAAQQVQGQADAANRQAIGAGALATVVGAGAGAAIGGGGRYTGRSAAAGAGLGIATGAAIGAQTSQNAQGVIQLQYDNAYAQCMYTRGDQVPGMPAMAQAAPAPALGGGPDPAMVGAVQSELARIGYADVQPDGAVGPRTRAAIVSFQRSNGLPDNGLASPRLLARLQGAPSGSAVAASVAPPAVAAAGPATDWAAPPPPATSQATAQTSDWTAPGAPN